MCASARNNLTLQQLTDAVSAHLKPGRVKDLKTAVRVLAKVLGYPAPDVCPPEAYAQPIEKLYELLDTAQAGKSEHTKRNSKNNLSLLFRTAGTHHLLPTATTKSTHFTKPKPKFDWDNRTSRKGSEASKQRHYYLGKDEWPPCLTQEFEQFAWWASTPLVQNRPAKAKKKDVTIRNYRQSFSAYFGYLHHEEKIPQQDLTLELLFDIDTLRRFVYWHVNTLHERVTRSIELFLSRVSTLLTQYKPNPTTLAQVTALRSELDKPVPVYDKKEVWVPLADLDAIGRAIWPTTMPRGAKCTGKGFARAAVMSLMIRLWCRRPYRQRNMREMEFPENLYKNGKGQWMIRFIGEELKVASKKGRQNHFELPFPPDLVADLEVYLSTWRPLLVQGKMTPSSHVFVNMNGTPFQTEQHLHLAVGSCVYVHTGKRFHPHLIRTIWATEYIRETHDFYGSAIMLNDTLETVIDNYAELLDSDTAVKADEWFKPKSMDPKKAPSVGLPSHNGHDLASKAFSLIATDPIIAPFLDEHAEMRPRIFAVLTSLLTAETASSLAPETKPAIPSGGAPLIPSLSSLL